MADAPERSEEMKANLGLPSSFHTAATGTAPASPAPAHDITKPMGLVEHLKALVGMDSSQNANKEPRHVSDAVNAALSEVDPNKPADGH